VPPGTRDTEALIVRVVDPEITDEIFTRAVESRMLDATADPAIVVVSWRLIVPVGLLKRASSGIPNDRVLLADPLSCPITLELKRVTSKVILKISNVFFMTIIFKGVQL
jgi:hypothetical protein